MWRSLMSCWGHSRPRILHLLSESAWYVRVRPLDVWDSHLMFKVFLSIEEKLEKGLKFPILKIFPQQSERCVAPWWWWWHSGIQHNWGKLGELLVRGVYIRSSPPPPPPPKLVFYKFCLLELELYFTWETDARQTNTTRHLDINISELIKSS